MLETKLKRNIYFKYCNTKDMLADILTKGIPKEQFAKLQKLIGIQKPNESNIPVLPNQPQSKKFQKTSWSVGLFLSLIHI